MTAEKMIFIMVLIAFKYEAMQAELSSADMMDILDEHNKLRGSVNPTVANMQKMVRLCLKSINPV